MFKMEHASEKLRKVAREKLTVLPIGWDPINNTRSREDCVPCARVYYRRVDNGMIDEITIYWGELKL